MRMEKKAQPHMRIVHVADTQQQDLFILRAAVLFMLKLPTKYY